MRSVETLERFMNDGCYEAMVRLREQGKVRFIGISELSEADGTHEVLQRAVPTGAFDVVMLTLNFLLQTAAESVLPLCRQHDVGAVVMMPLNQPSKESGLVSLPAALECIRRHVAAGNLPAEPPYTEADVLDFIQPYSVPEAGLRYVLSHDVSVCCVGMRSPERLRQNLRAVAPPYLDPERKARLQSLFGGISKQVLGHPAHNHGRRLEHEVSADHRSGRVRDHRCAHPQAGRGRSAHARGGGVDLRAVGPALLAQ